MYEDSNSESHVPVISPDAKKLARIIHDPLLEELIRQERRHKDAMAMRIEALPHAHFSENYMSLKLKILMRKQMKNVEFCA